MKKIFKVLFIALLSCLTLFGAVACSKEDNLDIDYSKYNYYGEYSHEGVLDGGAKLDLDLSLNTDNSYEMELKINTGRELFFITEVGEFTMEKLDQTQKDDSGQSLYHTDKSIMLYSIKFSPIRSTGYDGAPIAAQGWGDITQNKLSDFVWVYCDIYDVAQTVVYLNENVEYTMKHVSTFGDNDSVDDGNEDSTLEYSITYLAGDNGTIDGYANQEIKEGEDGLEVTAVPEYGYAFDGWSDGVTTATRKETNVNGDITITANFKLINFYTVTFYDEKEISTISVQENSMVKLGYLTKEGYDFEGWLINGQTKSANENFVIEENTVAYAQWSIITYDITYHLNGGTLENKKSSFTIKDLPYVLPTPTPYVNLCFSGWKTNESENSWLGAIEELKDYELYAQYVDAIDYFNFSYNNILGGYVIEKFRHFYCDSLVIPETYKDIPVVAIMDYAFNDYQPILNLTNIEIPKTIEYIGSSWLDYCNEVINITVDKDNENYMSIDGNLYSKGGEKLLKYAPGKIEQYFNIPFNVTSIGSSAFHNSSLYCVSIPYGIKEIGAFAFSNCKYLKEIELPRSVESIGSHAFYNSSLESLVIPENVRSIGNECFKECSNLKTMVINSWFVANDEWLLDQIQYCSDVYIRTDITVTASVYSVLFNMLCVEEIDGVEYYHYRIKE